MIPDDKDEEEQAKRNVVSQPGKEDVHEQREPEQPREGVVEKPAREVPRPPPSKTSQR